MSKIYLDVAYDDKDEAKAGGAKWDAAARKWYFWQDGDEPLPAALESFAPTGGAKSEAAINGQIGEIIAAVQAAMAAAITAARTAMAAAVEKSEDIMLIEAAEHVAAISDADIEAAALDLLAAMASTERQNLDWFLAGKAADPTRALLATFGGHTTTARERLAALQGATADILVREAMRRMGQQFARAKNAADKAERKAAAMARAEEIIAAINLDEVDFGKDVYEVAGAKVEFAIGNMSWMYIDKIDGRSDVIDSKGEFCAWLSQMPSVQALSDAITDRWLNAVVNRTIPSSKFERQCAREAIAKRAERANH